LEGVEPSAGYLVASPACRALPRRAGGSRVRMPRRSHCVGTLRSEGEVSREQQLSNIAITNNWPALAPTAESYLATIRERSRMTIGGYRGASATESRIALTWAPESWSGTSSAPAVTEPRGWKPP
jgi:hypothetical protein